MGVTSCAPGRRGLVELSESEALSAIIERDDLREQLAERDALLEEALGSVYIDAGRCESGAVHRDLVELSERIRPTLSASAVPSECSKCGSLTTGKCQAGCWFERDEQAAFKARFADYLSGANKLGTSYNNPVARGMEIGWMARAGVPGKPSQP